MGLYTRTIDACEAVTFKIVYLGRRYLWGCIREQLTPERPLHSRFFILVISTFGFAYANDFMPLRLFIFMKFFVPGYLFLNCL